MTGFCRGLWMLADSMIFAILAALLISTLSAQAGSTGLEQLSVSTQLEDVATAASNNPGAVLSACGERHFPLLLQVFLAPAFEQFRSTRFELECGGSTIILSEPPGGTARLFVLSSNRVIVSQDGREMIVATFRAIR